MNINKRPTTLSCVDSFKSAFRRVFGALPTAARGHVVGFLGEFMRTISFLAFAFAGGQTGAASSNPKEDDGRPVPVSTAPSGGLSPQVLLYIALSAGFSLAVNAWTFFRVSGGMFNPMVCSSRSYIGSTLR